MVRPAMGSREGAVRGRTETIFIFGEKPGYLQQ